MTDGELTQHAQQGHHGNGSGQERTGAQPSPDLDDSDLTDRHNFHLLVADAGITEGYESCQVYVALCGEKLRGPALPNSTCPEDCRREITYCLGCLRVANERNYDAGLPVEGPPGVRFVGSRASDPSWWAQVPWR